MENIVVFPQLIKHRPDKSGDCPIVIAVMLNRKIIATDKTHKKVAIKNWDPEKKLTKSDDLVNALLQKRVGELQNEFTRRQLLGEQLTEKLIKTIVAGNQIGGCFHEFAEWVIENKKLDDGLPFDVDTKRRYKNETNRIKLFSPNLQIRDITTEFLYKYHSWLINTHKKKDGKALHKNSIWKGLSVIRMLCNEAIREGLMPADKYPFRSFKIGKCETDISKIKYLEKNEVEAIEKVLLENERNLEDLTVRVGWRFLAMCVCGMRISDAMRLNQSYFNDAGTLNFTPHKTRRKGNIAQVPIVSDRQKRYLQKTLSMPLPDKDPKSFRTIFNEHLKILAAHAGIYINLTSHVGRHTMGAFMVDADIQTKVAMAMLGVKSENTIKVYSHLKQSKLLQEANKMNNVF